MPPSAKAPTAPQPATRATSRPPEESPPPPQSRSLVSSSHRHRNSQLLAQDAAHHLIQILARLFEHKLLRRIRPAQLKTRRKRRNPDLPQRRLRADHKSRANLILKLDFDLSAAVLDFEFVIVADHHHPLRERRKCLVALLIKLLLIHQGVIGREFLPSGARSEALGYPSRARLYPRSRCISSGFCRHAKSRSSWAGRAGLRISRRCRRCRSRSDNSSCSDGRSR